MKKCNKCGIEFEPKKGLKNYCSLSCRNSRVFSESSKEKKRIATISNWKQGLYDDSRKKGVTYKTIKCIECDDFFSIPKWKNQKYCSLNCVHNSTEHKKKISKKIKELYKNGKKVYGGKTKWINVKTSKGILRVQGSYEERACKLLDRFLKSGEIIDWEYTNDRFSYVNVKGLNSIYLLDFKVYTTEGFYYIETKGRIVENDYLKWSKVRNEGYKLIIWEDKDLKNYGV